MSIDKYRFVSPGVQIKEIDQSRRTEPAADPGPVIIGRFQKGVTMRPVKVDSLSELNEIFGDTITGRETVDASRHGNYSAPSYAAFAANAWLANNGGATIVRLAGKQAENATEGSGEAGWTVAAHGGIPASASAGRGGAWGLWVIPSGSNKEMTGTLGAIFYCEGDTGVVLSGTIAGASANVQAAGVGIKSTTGNLRAKVITSIGEASSSIAGDTNEDVSFNFNPTSRNFIRKVFNTTPHNTNTDVVPSSSAESRKYWLGETFEDSVQQLISSQGSGSNLIAFTAPLVSGSNYFYDHSFDAQPSKTGWVFSQDTSTDYAQYSPANMQKLFRFVSLEEGEWTQRNLKVSIQNIRVGNLNANPNAYGSFDVVIRKMKDSDSNPQIVEIYAGCNLNPASADFIAARIGDQRAIWNNDTKRYQYYGTYPNVSKYFYVELASAVDEGTISNELVPFGFYGLPKPASVTVEGRGADGDGRAAFIQSFSGSALRSHDAAVINNNNFQIYLGSTAGVGAGALTASLQWPDPKLVVSASSNTQLSDPTDIYFGYEFTRDGSTVFDESTYDILKPYAKALGSDNWDTTGNMIYSHYFSLDDVSASSPTTLGFIYSSGSRVAGTSYTADQTDGTQALIDAGYDKFTMPFYGGFDGLEVKEMEPLINNRGGSNAVIGSTVEESYELNTLRRAIDTVADPELVDMNLLLLPGVTKASITDHMINTCETRADSMAIIDIPYAWTPRHESDNGSESARNVGNTVSQAVTTVRGKGYNSSYAATYYPWVQVREPVSGLPTWCPPSVVALGAMSYGDRTQAPWFAPAGFTRGGLSAGRGGLPVIAVSQRLTSKQRDSLYENNINPIAHFPAEGIVIFGQKTLQADPTALDRINVRRLLIFLKKRISNIAATLLFEPNVTATFGRFLSQARPLLSSVQTGFGIEDFKIVLDSTTTTADLVDRNTMYAKIFIKPTKAIEFIAIDFVITNQGASFDD